MGKHRWWWTVAAMAGWVALATAQEKPLITYQAAGSTLSLSRNGTFTVSDAAGAYLEAATLQIFGPGWKASSQNQAKVVEARLRGETASLSLTMTEAVSGLEWEVRQTVRPADGGWRIDYEATPRASMTLNELSLVLDLPQPRFSGQGLSLHPAEELVFPAVQPANYHFVSAAASRYVFARGRTDQMLIETDRPRLLNVQDARAFGRPAYQAFVKIIQTAGEVKAGEPVKLSLRIVPAETTDWRLPRLDLESAAPLRIGTAHWDPAQVGRPCTLEVALTGTWQTPFWSEEVALDATITAPDGSVRRVPGYYTMDYERSAEVVGGTPVEHLKPQDQPGWRVRWLPDAAGPHKVELAAHDKSGTVSWSGQIDVAPGQARPFIRVSPRDHHYFEFTDGQPYFANGLNVCWYRGPSGTADYDRWFGALAANGGNYARVWMPSWAFGFEWGKPGVYRMDRCAQFDYVLGLAAEKGIRIKLCLENFREFDGQNPYAKANSGPCETVLDVFQNAQAKRMWRNRLRYAVARWGWSPNILAWELWNENDCVQGYKAPVVQAWAREMCGYLKSIDPRHLTVNSLGSFVFEPDLWSSKEIDFAQMHGYWHPKWKSTEFGKDMAQMMADHVAMVRGFDKPAFFAEFGLVNESWGLSPRSDDDKQGVNLHNGLWGAMMAGAAGTGHLWWWDNYVEPRNLWYHFKGVSAFVDGVPWTTAAFTPTKPVCAPAEARAFALTGAKLSLVWVQNRAHTWWNVAQKTPIPPVAGTTVTVPGAKGATVEVWDTWTGQRVRSAVAESDTIALGSLEKDIALKIIAP